MAQPEPLFHDSFKDLTVALRLSGTDERADSTQVIKDALAAFKVELIRRMGFTDLSALQAISEVDTPTTTDELRRMAARMLEIKWVWCECIKRLQSMFADASGGAFQDFNEQGVWRQLDADDRRQLLRECQVDIENLFTLVLDEDTVGDHASIEVFDGTDPDSAGDYFPAGSIFPNLGVFPGNFLVPSLSFGNGALWRAEE